MKGIIRLFVIILILSGEALGATIYINPSCTNFNGNGNASNCALSQGGPGAYNSFAEVNTLNGAQNNLQILLRAGTTINGSLGPIEASNITVGRYGDGSDPIINASRYDQGIYFIGHGVNNVTVQNIHVIASDYNGIQFTDVDDNINVLNNTCDSSGLDGIAIYGRGSANPSAGVVVQGNSCSNNANNAIELWGVTGAMVSDNSGTGNGGHGVELWGYVTNSTVTRNTYDACANGFWITPDVQYPPDTGHSSNITLTYNTFSNIQHNGIRIASGSGNQVAYNTVTTVQPQDNTYGWCALVVQFSAGGNIYGNTILVNDPRGSDWQYGIFVDSSAGPVTGGYNDLCYVPTASFPRSKWQGLDITDLGSWESASGFANDSSNPDPPSIPSLSPAGFVFAMLALILFASYRRSLKVSK